MAQIKLNEAQIFNNLKENGYLLQFISGKWFLNGKEYKLYGMGGITYILCNVMPSYFGSEANTNKFIKWVINTRSDTDGEWPEMPILKLAKEKIAEGYIPPKELAYPLNEKELKIIHYLLDGDPKDTYAIFFCGAGGTGKSSVCNVMASLFGESDVCTCGFNQITEKFAREPMAGKRLWYDADINAAWSDKSSNIFKKIITHDKDQFEKKGKDPYTARYRCKALFCCNTPPKFDLTDSCILRRILYYYKNDKIKNPNGEYADKKYTQEELLDIAVTALLTDMTNWTDDFIEDTHKIIIETNSVGKYGMVKEYDTYVELCQSARVLPYGKEKWEILKEIFKQWKSTLETVDMSKGVANEEMRKLIINF